MVKNSWKTMYMYEQYRDLWAEPSLEEDKQAWEELSQEERDYYIRALDVITTIEMLGFTPSKELVENVMKEYEEKQGIAYITRDERVHADFMMMSAFSGGVTEAEIDERREALITSRLNNIPVPMPVYQEMHPPVETFGLDVSCNLGAVVTVDKLFDRCLEIDSMRVAEITIEEPEPKKKSYRQEVRQFLNKGKRW